MPVTAFGLVVIAVLAARNFSDSSEAHNLSDIPIAFWAWQTETPSGSEIQQALDQTRARTLFLRAGQIDYVKGQPKRIRAVRGSLPRHIELHLVYNATRLLLVAFERITPEEMASAVSDAFEEDCIRALLDGAQVVGLQLDIDSPTRLLKHYTRILKSVRKRLPAGVKLSVTGLPTWMASDSLVDMLSQTDFWVPQFYGSQMPERLEQQIPISSPETVARYAKKARRLGHPFYAGLAAYGYAILYSSNGSFISLRGDIDPALIANDTNLRLIESKPFAKGKDSAALASEWRCVYQVMRETVIDGLAAREGDLLMLDLPSIFSLRATAKAACKEADQSLLGLCIFRLPAQDDPTNLTIKEVSDALSDRDGVFSFDARAVKQIRENNRHQVLVTITNSGSICPQEINHLMKTVIEVPQGSVREAQWYGFDEYYTVSASWAWSVGYDTSLRRAKSIELKTRWLRPGTSASVIIEFNESPPAELPIRIAIEPEQFSRYYIYAEEKIVNVESENGK